MTKYAAVAAVLAASLLTACNASIQTGKAVHQSELEKQVAGLYTPDNPEDSIDVTCAGDLGAKVGAQQTCHIVVGSSSVEVRVAATKVEGSKVDFTSTPFLKAQTVADTIDQQLKEQNVTTTSISCDDDLVGEVGRTTTCHAATKTDQGDLKATVTKVDGLKINFRWKGV